MKTSMFFNGFWDHFRPKKVPPMSPKPKQDETESKLTKPDAHDDQAIENSNLLIVIIWNKGIFRS